MSYTPMNGWQYESARPRPIYPPYLTALAGTPTGQQAFPTAEPGYPAMLPGFPGAQPAPRAPVPAAPVPAAPVPAAPVPAEPVALAAASRPAPNVAEAGQAPFATSSSPSTPSNLATHERAYAAYQRAQSAQVQQQTHPSAATGLARRPRVLALAAGSGLTASALTVTSQLLALRDGRAALASWLSGEVPDRDSALGSFLAAAVAGAYRTIQLRAAVSIGLAALVAVLCLLCLRAGLAARIASVAAMSLSTLLLMACLFGIFPEAARLAGLGALGLFPVTAALLFVPAVGRYRTARNSRRNGQVGVPLIPAHAT